MNTNRFQNEDEWIAKRIYNYNPVYTPNDPDFTVQYIFDESKLWYIYDNLKLMNIFYIISHETIYNMHQILNGHIEKTFRLW